METLRTGQVATADGLQVAYVQRGEAPTLVVPSASWMAADLEGLCPERDVLFYDLRGRGRSSAVFDEASLGLDRDLDDLRRLLDERGIERASLLGWSYHGLLAACFALEHPGRVEKLVLVGSVAPRAQPHFDDFMEAFATRVDLEELTAVEERKRAGASPAELGSATHRVFFGAYVGDRARLADMKADPAVPPNEDASRVNDQGRRVLQKLGAFDWRERFRALTTPTLVLHGERDPVPVAGAHEWLEVLPDARLEVLPGLGHLPWVEDGPRFRSLVEGFLG